MITETYLELDYEAIASSPVSFVLRSDEEEKERIIRAFARHRQDNAIYQNGRVQDNGKKDYQIKIHRQGLSVSDFYCYFCIKTSDIDSNSQQSAETSTVANSLPLFYPFSQTSYKQGGYKSLPELRKILILKKECPPFYNSRKQTFSIFYKHITSYTTRSHSPAFSHNHADHYFQSTHPWIFTPLTHR